MSTPAAAVRPAYDRRPDGPDDTAWRDAAACQDADPELFFPEGEIRSAAAFDQHRTD